MGPLIPNRYKAFSLPETIVALVFILSVFMTATMILTGTGRTALTPQKLKAGNLLRQFAQKTREERLFVTDSVQIEGFRLYRVVSPYPGYDSLLTIHYYIADQNNKRLADWRSLVRSDH